jgi:hypothetical protein
MRCLFRLGLLILVGAVVILVVLYLKGCFKLPGQG